MTAGEIEARDAAERINLTAEQRKNTRPDVDRKDVVFAESSSISYFAKDEYDAETAGIKDQIRNSQAVINKMDVVYSGNVPTHFMYIGLFCQMVQLSDLTKTKMQIKKCIRECLKGLLPILQDLHL